MGEKRNRRFTRSSSSGLIPLANPSLSLVFSSSSRAHLSCIKHKSDFIDFSSLASEAAFVAMEMAICRRQTHKIWMNTELGHSKNSSSTEDPGFKKNKHFWLSSSFLLLGSAHFPYVNSPPGPQNLHCHQASSSVLSCFVHHYLLFSGPLLCPLISPDCNGKYQSMWVV